MLYIIMPDMKVAIYFLSIILFLTACAGGTLNQSTDFYMTGRIQSKLMPPSVFKGATTYSQVLQSTYDGKTNTVTSVMTLSPERMRLIGFSDAARLFTITYDGDQIDSEFSALIPLKKIHPAYILADIQLIYYPAAGIREYLPAGIKMTEQKTQKGMVREVFSGDKKIIRITYDDATVFAPRVEFENLERAYSYVITNAGEK